MLTGGKKGLKIFTKLKKSSLLKGFKLHPKTTANLFTITAKKSKKVLKWGALIGGVATVGAIATLGTSEMSSKDEEEFAEEFDDESGDACPIVPDVDETVFRKYKSLIDKTGFFSAVTSSWYGSGKHGYVYARCIGDVPKMLTVERLYMLMSNPMLWPALWMGTFPHGGVHSVITNMAGELQLTLTVPFLFRKRGDPITMSKVVTSVPRSLEPKLADGTYFLSQSFQARTMVGHALTGTVRHCLIVCDGKIYVVWVGLGKGPPILGDVGNYVVALHPTMGTWPIMSKSLKRIFSDNTGLAKTIEAIEAMDVESPTPPSFTPLSMTVILGRSLTTLGVPVRWGSELAGRLSGTTGTVKGTTKTDK